LPKAHFDWFTVATLWLGAAIMAIRTGDIPLIEGMPAFFASALWGYVPFVLVSLYGIVALWRKQQEPDDSKYSLMDLLPKSANVTAAKPEEPSERVYVNLAPEDLQAACVGKTTVHAIQVSKIYEGKWMRFDGHVRDVWLYDSPYPYAIISLFDEDVDVIAMSHETAKAEVIHKDDLIEVVGKIVGIRESGISLDYAEITSL
jgi:hypothetical protein